MRGQELIFTRHCHTTWYVLKLIVLWVFIRLLKKIEGREAPIFANLQTQSRHFEPHHSIKVVHILSIMLGKSKTKGSVRGCARMPIPIMMGSHHQWLRLVVSLGMGMEEVNIQLATWCLILRVGFAAHPIQRRQCHGWKCFTWATVKLGSGPHIVVLIINLLHDSFWMLTLNITDTVFCFCTAVSFMSHDWSFWKSYHV